MTIKEFLEDQLKHHEKRVAKLTEMLTELPKELGALESDIIYDLGYAWLVLSDSSHKDLGAKLATISGQSVHFKHSNSDPTLRIAQFRDVGPFWWVDLRRPKKGCKTVRVRTLPKELTITICGELPDRYEYIGEAEA